MVPAGARPKNGAKLSDAQVAAFAQWIRDGAPWPSATLAPSATSATATTSRETVITAEQRGFWSFQPLRQNEPPAVSRNDWPKSPIDRLAEAFPGSELIEEAG